MTDEEYEMDEWEREWRNGERVPGVIVALFVAVVILTIIACARFL